MSRRPDSVVVISRRTFATVLERPTIEEDELPVPIVAEGAETAADTLNITAAAEKVCH